MSGSVDVSDVAVQSAWKSLTDEKSPINWMIVGIADAKSSSSVRLELIDQSSAGFAALKRKLSSIGGRIVFGALLVEAIDHRNETVTSTRHKFVSFSFTGANVPELHRAQSSFQKNAVATALFKGAHLNMELTARDLSSFTERTIVKRLHTATAAHKPSHYKFGKDGKEFSVEEIEQNDDDDNED